jgi:diacylglycerol O-acyltransferase
LADLARGLLQPTSKTPINGDLGPHRNIDWLTMPLEDVRDLRRVLDCTVNDIILATVNGALRRYLFRRRVDPARLDFRISAPVNVRKPEHENQMGNHVSSWILPMPLEEPNPLATVEAIAERTRELKRKNASLGVETMMEAAEWLPAGVIARGVGMVQGQINMIVTNVPGPQFPLFSVGARLLGLYPAVPLLPGGGLGIALFSYEGKLCWGFNGDDELVPDLETFVADVRKSFEDLRNASVARFLERRTARPEECADGEEGTRAPVAEGARPEPAAAQPTPSAHSKRQSRSPRGAPEKSNGVPVREGVGPGPESVAVEATSAGVH